MANVSCVLLSGITVTPIYSQSTSNPVVFPQFQGPDASDPSYQLLFEDIDGVICYEPGTIPGNPSSVIAYYELVGGGGGGNGGSSSAEVIGFDATAGAPVGVIFHLGEKGPIVEAQTGQQVASGTIDTSKGETILFAPQGDGLTQDSLYEPAVFSYWYNVLSHDKQATGSSEAKLGSVEVPVPIYNGPLTLQKGAGGIYLAVYVAALKPLTPPVPVKQWPPIHAPSNCPELLANLKQAAAAYAANPTGQLWSLLAEAQQAAAPCIAGA
jgi:hypothetical protein